MSSSALSVTTSENKDYILEGVFGQIDQKNKNNRIYTESEYVPQIEALQAKIKASKLLGELDHPAQFDISLKNVSHIIEELTYDKESKQVRGRIKLLDTDAGRQAKALVDAGVPLQISSRAAGAVESNGQVKIKQLFTYDLVADPGFENAELKRVNESYGYDNDGLLSIYELNSSEEIPTENINPNTQIKENKNMAEFVKSEDFNKYSEYLANEIKTLKESIEAKDTELAEDTTLDNLKEHNNSVVETVNNLTEYVGYVAEKLDESIQYSEHVAEKTDQSISYSEELAEKLDKGISYTEHIAESVTKVKDFANYLAEAHNEGTTSHTTLLEYVEYLKENLQSVSEYAEYIAESLNETVEEVAVNVESEEAEEEEIEAADKVEGEEVAKEVAEDKAKEIEDENLELAEESEDPAKEADEADETEEIENIGDNSEEGAVSKDGEDAGKEVEEIEDEEVEAGDNSTEGDVEGEVAGEDAEDLESEAEAGDSEIKVGTKAAKAGEGEEEAEGEEGALDPLEAYKNEISSKLNTLVENATKKDNENPNFFRVVSSTTREKYNTLSESAKSEVRNTVSKRGFMTESEIVTLMNNSQLIVESAGVQPTFIALMPTEYSEAWTNLTEAKQNQIVAQAKYHTLNTEYQVANFWQTRDLRDTKVEMEKVAMVAESKTEAPKSTLGYNVTPEMANAFKQRFNK
jgi:hypothetical protein|tara:strand:+ start:15800 stop:17875 length:2076 start_codon:yes stop_codon:yes gene_type:complete